MYVSRWFSSCGQWRVGRLRLKAYGISWRKPEPARQHEPVPPELVSAAHKYVGEHLPAAAEAEGHHGLGFVIIHEGEHGCWLLADWWAHSEICCQLLAHAPWPTSADFAPVDRPLLACVWEAVVISAEREAWVETMLNGHPQPEAYLERRLPEGSY
jgi:hypothetical protein